MAKEIKVIKAIQEATAASEDDVRAMLSLCNGDVNAATAALIDSPFQAAPHKVKKEKAPPPRDAPRGDRAGGRRGDSGPFSGRGGPRGGRGGDGSRPFNGGRGAGEGRGSFGGRARPPPGNYGGQYDAAPTGVAWEAPSASFGQSEPAAASGADWDATGGEQISQTQPAAQTSAWGAAASTSAPTPAAAPAGSAWGSSAAKGAGKTLADILKEKKNPPPTPEIPKPATPPAPVPEAVPSSPQPSTFEEVDDAEEEISPPTYQAPAGGAWGQAPDSAAIINNIAMANAGIISQSQHQHAVAAAAVAQQQEQTLSAADNAVSVPSSNGVYGAYTAQDKAVTTGAEVEAMQLSFGSFGLGGQGLGDFGASFSSSYGQPGEVSSLLQPKQQDAVPSPVQQQPQQQQQQVQQQQADAYKPTNYGTYTLGGNGDKIAPASSAVSAAEQNRQQQLQQQQQAQQQQQQVQQQQAQQQQAQQQQAANYAAYGSSTGAFSTGFGASGFGGMQPQDGSTQAYGASPDTSFAGYNQEGLKGYGAGAYSAPTGSAAYGMQQQQQAPGVSAQTYNPAPAKYANTYTQPQSGQQQPQQQGQQQQGQQGQQQQAQGQQASADSSNVQAPPVPSAVPQMAAHYGNPQQASGPPGMYGNYAAMNPMAQYGHQFSTPVNPQQMYAMYNYAYPNAYQGAAAYPPQAATSYPGAPASNPYGAARNPYPGYNNPAAVGVTGAAAQVANAGYAAANPVGAYGLVAGAGGYEDVSAGAAGAAGNYNIPNKKQDEAAMYGMGGGQQAGGGYQNQHRGGGNGGYGGYGGGMPQNQQGYNNPNQGYGQQQQQQQPKGGYGGNYGGNRQYSNQQQYGPPAGQSQQYKGL